MKRKKIIYAFLLAVIFTYAVLPSVNAQAQEAGGSQSMFRDPTVLADYAIAGKNIELADKPHQNNQELANLQNEDDMHAKIWQWAASILPLDEVPFLKEFRISTDGNQGFYAMVEPKNGDLNNWSLMIDIKDFQSQGGGSGDGVMVHALVHEFGHLLTLNNNQVSPLSINMPDSSQKYLEMKQQCSPNCCTKEGCTKNDSYLNQFYDKYWKSMNAEWETYQSAGRKPI